MSEVLNNVVNVISGLDGVLEVRQLSNDDILKIIDMEAQRSKDLVPVFNEGVQECFKRDIKTVFFQRFTANRTGFIRHITAGLAGIGFYIRGIKIIIMAFHTIIMRA